MKAKSFLVVAILAVTILGFGFAVNAQTTDVSAMIAQLKIQITQLQTQLQTLLGQQNRTQTWCHTFNTYIVVGSTGSEVQSLQTALNKEGLLTTDNIEGDNGPTMNPNYQNIFGENTAAAVVQFQGKYNIRQTGTVGPITRGKLNSLYGCGVVPTTQPSINVTSPNGGENIQIGQKFNITWNSSGLDNSNVYISLKDDSRYCAPELVGCWTGFPISVSANSGNYLWDTNNKMGGDSGPNTVPVTAGSKYRIEICSADGKTCSYSASDFSISAPGH